MSPETWFAFFIACWIISLTPGAGALACMTSGLSHGFRTGYWNALGLQLALLAQILVVAAGLGALLATSETAFNLIKWFGIAYLIYLGWKQWRAPATILQPSAEAPARGTVLTLILRGFLVNASNPKAIIFILAVLPQFLNTQAPLLEQYAVMAATMILVDLTVMAGYTILAANLLRLLRHPRYQGWMNKAFGGTFMGAALLMVGVKQS